MHGMRRVVVLAAAAAVLLSGCSGGSKAAPVRSNTGSADALFLSVARPVFAPNSDADDVSDGHDICRILATGDNPQASYAQAVSVMTGNGISAFDAGRVVAAATVAYCPDQAADAHRTSR